MDKFSIYDMKYNSLRDEALKRVESKDNKPGNVELNYLGLTTYLESDTLNSSLFDKIISAQNSRRRIQHIKDQELFLMPLQVEALKYLSNHNRAIILAPTSFGKTLVIKEYIYINKPKNVVYLVPTNALSYELEVDLKSNTSFDDYDIFSKVSKNNRQTGDKKLFFIGTQEKYSEVSDMFDNVDLFIIDEAYKLADKINEQRGYILSKSFLDSIKNKAKQIVLLCPNANLVGFNGYGFEDYFVTTFNAVSKQFIKCIDQDDLFSKLNQSCVSEKTILFCETPKEISEICPKIKRNEYSKEYDKLLHHLITDFHEEWSVVKYLKKGILVHHGQMPKYIQNKMINLFNKTDFSHLLIGTNSISEGINTPTKNIFIDPSVNVSQKLMLIKNTIGRAGRLGKMPVGYIYSVENIKNLYKNDPSIVLTISNEEDLKTVEDTYNDLKIGAAAEQYGFEQEFVKKLLKEHQMSLAKLLNILKELRNKMTFPNFENIVFVSKKCMKYDGNPYEDKIYLKGFLQNQYKTKKGIDTYIYNFKDRVTFYKEKAESEIIKSDSDIIDGYMRFMYSTLDYKVLPIALIAKKIHDSYPNWDFGENVYKCINEFLRRYYFSIYGVSNFDVIDDDIKSIMASFREYGINLKDQLITPSFLSVIKSHLAVRYSMYDIVKVLVDLSKDKDNPYRKTCLYLLEKYITQY